MYTVRPVWLMRKFYPEAVWKIPCSEKKIFLTFDDGPVPEVTPMVLSVLKQFNAKATFFCVGENIQKHPEIFKQILAEPHAVGNHTYHHLNGWKVSFQKYIQNIEQCHYMLSFESSTTTFTTPLFRPPYGKMKPSQYVFVKRKYSIIMWDVLSGDFDKNLSAEKCLYQTIKHVRSGSIVVFHDSTKASKNLFYTLPRFLEHLANKGFTFDKIAG